MQLLLLFPLNTNTNERCSVKSMRRCIAVALLCICCQRKIISRNCKRPYRTNNFLTLTDIQIFQRWRFQFNRISLLTAAFLFIINQSIAFYSVWQALVACVLCGMLRFIKKKKTQPCLTDIKIQDSSKRQIKAKM